jgi:hypothetical protein
MEEFFISLGLVEACAILLFMAVIYPSLIFADKAGAYPRGTPYDILI